MIDMFSNNNQTDFQFITKGNCCICFALAIFLFVSGVKFTPMFEEDCTGIYRELADVSNPSNAAHFCGGLSSCGG
jgi:hypothetical protein